MSLALHLFGAVQVTWNDAPLKFATEHARALLAYLAVEADVVHPRTTLATLLWPEENEATARHNLRQALCFLKQTLGKVAQRDVILYITPTTIKWNSQGVEVDLRAFQQVWRLTQTHSHANVQQCALCIEHFTQALTFYRGEFLHGLLPKNSQPFEEWALLLREQAHRQAMAMLGTLTAHHMAVDAFCRRRSQRAGVCLYLGLVPGPVGTAEPTGHGRADLHRAWQRHRAQRTGGQRDGEPAWLGRCGLADIRCSGSGAYLGRVVGIRSAPRAARHQRHRQSDRRRGNGT